MSSPLISLSELEAVRVEGARRIEPVDANGFELAPGNRLDLDVTFRSEDRGREFRIVDRFTRSPIPLATIRVADEVVPTPRFPSPARAHIPAWRGAADLVPDAGYLMDARAGGPFGIEWTLNGEAFPRDHSAGHSAELMLGRWTKLRL